MEGGKKNHLWARWYSWQSSTELLPYLNYFFPCQEINRSLSVDWILKKVTRHQHWEAASLRHPTWLFFFSSLPLENTSKVVTAPWTSSPAAGQVPSPTPRTGASCLTLLCRTSFMRSALVWNINSYLERWKRLHGPPWRFSMGWPATETTPLLRSHINCCPLPLSALSSSSFWSF